MFKGDIFITSDENVALASAMNQSFKVMVLADNAYDIFGAGAPVYPISYLLPPYAALEMEDMGNLNGFYESYYSHLMSDEVDSYICLILAGLYKGYNILIYVPQDEAQMTFVSALLQYIQTYFGLTIGTPQYPCGFNVQFEDIDQIKMFRHGYIEAIDVCKNIKGNIVDPIIANMLCKELNLKSADPLQTINAYIQHVKSTNLGQQQSIAGQSVVPFTIMEGF